jgi:transposase
MDTTSVYFEGAGGQTLGRRGSSKDHRPDLHQMILAVLLDGDGRPVCTEMWPGNTADTGSLFRWSTGSASGSRSVAFALSPIAA